MLEPVPSACPALAGGFFLPLHHLGSPLTLEFLLIVINLVNCFHKVLNKISEESNNLEM